MHADGDHEGCARARACRSLVWRRALAGHAAGLRLGSPLAAMLSVAIAHAQCHRTGRFRLQIGTARGHRRMRRARELSTSAPARPWVVCMAALSGHMHDAASAGAHPPRALAPTHRALSSVPIHGSYRVWYPGIFGSVPGGTTSSTIVCLPHDIMHSAHRACVELASAEQAQPGSSGWRVGYVWTVV